MDNTIKEMIKSVAKYNAYVAITLLACGLFYMGYTKVLIIGLIVGTVNFVLRAFINGYCISDKKGKLFMILIGSTRIIVVVLIGIIVFTYNKFNIIAYSIGFISHFVGIMIYAIDENHKKGSK